LSTTVTKLAIGQLWSHKQNVHRHDVNTCCRDDAAADNGCNYTTTFP